MPYLQNKSKGSSAWLPSQVDYGMDCSDDNPKNWKPFGRVVNDQEQAKTASSTKAAPKVGLPE